MGIKVSRKPALHKSCAGIKCTRPYCTHPIFFTKTQVCESVLLMAYFVPIQNIQHFNGSKQLKRSVAAGEHMN